MTHIHVSEPTIIGSDNGLSPDRCQAIIWTNAGLLLIEPLGTNFSEISNKILTFSFTKMRLKVSSAKWRPFCLGINVLRHGGVITPHTKQWVWLLIHALLSYSVTWLISPRQNGRHFAADTFKCISVKEKFCFFIRISLKFVPKGPSDNTPALV